MFNPVLGSEEEQMGTAAAQCFTLVWLTALGCCGFGSRLQFLGMPQLPLKHLNFK